VELILNLKKKGMSSLHVFDF